MSSPPAGAAPPPPPSALPRRGLSSRAKLGIGCAVVLALGALAAVVALCSGVYWAMSPGRQRPTAIVIGPGSAGVVHAGDLARDEGATALFAAVFEELQKTGAQERDQELPPFLRKMQEWNRANAGRSLQPWMPTEATLSFEPHPEHGLVPVAALNFRMYVRPIRAMLERFAGSDPSVRKTEYAGRTILAFASGPALSFVDGTVVLAQRPEVLHPVIDRAARLGDDAPPLPLSMTSLPGRWDLRATLDAAEGARDFALFLLSTGNVADPHAIAETSDVQAARWGLDAESADRARVLVELTYADKVRTWAAAPVWKQTLEDLRRNVEPWGLDVQGSARGDGERLTLELQLDGVPTAVGRYLAAMQAETERRRSEEEAEE